MTHSQDLAGMRAVVTGADGVLGRWIAQTLSEVGVTLCLTDIDPAPLAPLLASLRPDPRSFTVAADLRGDAGIAAVVEAVGARWGSADILVNNAGLYPSGFLLDIDGTEWDRIFDVNLRAPFLLTQGIARQMIAAKTKGSVINISSGASRRMRRTVVPYCTSKTALDRLTKGFALELAEFGIRVNALEPGFAAGSTSSVLPDEHIAATADAIPLGRPTTPEDLGNALLFLASPAAGYVTGATLTVDGGISIGSMAVYQDKKSPL